MCKYNILFIDLFKLINRGVGQIDCANKSLSTHSLLPSRCIYNTIRNEVLMQPPQSPTFITRGLMSQRYCISAQAFVGN